MLRKLIFIYTFTITMMCILLSWYSLHLKTPCKATCTFRPSKQPNIQTQKKIEHRKKILGNRKKILRNRKKISIKTTQPAPTTPLPPPTLTMDAQDSFYGFGCEENPYRKRLQMLLWEWGLLTKRRNITQYFLCFGSLLGSVRNGDLIPYDSDVDICMMRHDYYKLEAEESKRPLDLEDGKIHFLLQRHSPHPLSTTPRKDCSGKIVRNLADECSILDPPARLYNGPLIYMDIFMIENMDEKLWDEFRDKLHDRGNIFPLRPCKYMGLKSNCPNDAEKYLTVYYGEDYAAPHYKCVAGKWKKQIVDAPPRLV